MTLRFEPVPVDTGSPDHEGLLVLAEGRLVAVLVRLAEPHDEAGRWFVEAGFGAFRERPAPTFADLHEAGDWFTGAAPDWVGSTRRPADGGARAVH